MKTHPSDSADKYVLRFEQPGHRDRLKEMAANEKRSLNKQLLILIEKGEDAIRKEKQEALQ